MSPLNRTCKTDDAADKIRGLPARALSQRELSGFEFAQRPDPSNRPPQQPAPAPAAPQRSTPPRSQVACPGNRAARTAIRRPYLATTGRRLAPGLQIILLGETQFINRGGSQSFPRQSCGSHRPPSSQYSRDEQYSRGGQNSYNSYRNNQQRLSPEERQRVLQNQQRFRQSSQQQ